MWINTAGPTLVLGSAGKGDIQEKDSMDVAISLIQSACNDVFNFLMQLQRIKHPPVQFV